MQMNKTQLRVSLYFVAGVIEVVLAAGQHSFVLPQQGSLLQRERAGPRWYVVVEKNDSGGTATPTAETFILYTYDKQQGATGKKPLLYVVEKNGEPTLLEEIYIYGDGSNMHSVAGGKQDGTKLDDTAIRKLVPANEDVSHTNLNFDSAPKLNGKAWLLLANHTQSVIGLVVGKSGNNNGDHVTYHYAEFEVCQLDGTEKEHEGKLYILFDDGAYHEIHIPREGLRDDKIFARLVSKEEHQHLLKHDKGTKDNCFPNDFKLIKHQPRGQGRIFPRKQVFQGNGPTAAGNTGHSLTDEAVDGG